MTDHLYPPELDSTVNLADDVCPNPLCAVDCGIDSHVHDGSCDTFFAPYCLCPNPQPTGTDECGRCRRLIDTTGIRDRIITHITERRYGTQVAS